MKSLRFFLLFSLTLFPSVTVSQVTWTATAGSVSQSGFYVVPQTVGSYMVTAWLGSATSSSTIEIKPAKADFYISTTGSDLNDGSFGKPFATFSKANSVVQPGQTIIVRGGIYKTNVSLTKSGAPGSPITWMIYPGERVIIDGSAIPPAACTRSDPWNGTPETIDIVRVHDVIIKGFEIVNSPNCSVMVQYSSDVVIDGITAHHGYQAGICFWTSQRVTVQNSHLYDFYDYACPPVNTNDGGNADCIHMNEDGTMPIGNHVIRNNLLHDCSDDGVDTWVVVGNLIEGNVVHHTGRAAGDGNGFKLGGSDSNGNNVGGGNTVRLNITYSNKMRAFVTNGGSGNVIDHNTAWDHIHSSFSNTLALPNTFTNNIVAGSSWWNEMDGAVHTGNSWDLELTCSFVSTDPASPDFLKATGACAGIGAR